MSQTVTAPHIHETDHRVRVDGGHLFARAWTPEGAAAAPIILVHDSLGSVALWRSFPKALAGATGRRVIAYDRLGFGQSDPHPGRLGVDFVAAEAEHGIPALADQLGAERFVLCGHSVGGGMAIEAAARHPERCAALVTIAAQSFVEDKTLEGIRIAQRSFEDPANLARLERYHGPKARWVVDAWVQSWLSPDFADWTVFDALERVSCPVLALHGELDEYGTRVHPERIAAGGRGTAHILPGIGHVPHREDEAGVTDRIRVFLEP